MKKQTKDQKEHGIISIVQSPDEGENNAVKEMEIAEENDPDKEKGIISVIQAPEKDQKRKRIGS